MGGEAGAEGGMIRKCFPDVSWPLLSLAAGWAVNEKPVESQTCVSSVPENSTFFGIMIPNSYKAKGGSLIKVEILENSDIEKP